MVKVVICNGKPGSGKTTVQDIAKRLCLCDSTARYWFGNAMPTVIDSCSTVDFVKEVATFCGWDGTKTLENRRFLSDLKDLLTNWGDVPGEKIFERVDKLDKLERSQFANWILFVDCREPAEIEKLKKRFNATTLLVRRLGDEVVETSNHADAEVFNYEYDYTIKNYGTLEDLQNEVHYFLKYMKGREFYFGN